jgi:hypothetical protein
MAPLPAGRAEVCDSGCVVAKWSTYEPLSASIPLEVRAVKKIARGSGE